MKRFNKLFTVITICALLIASSNLTLRSLNIERGGSPTGGFTTLDDPHPTGG